MGRDVHTRVALAISLSENLQLCFKLVSGKCHFRIETKPKKISKSFDPAHERQHGSAKAPVKYLRRPSPLSLASKLGSALLAPYPHSPQNLAHPPPHPAMAASLPTAARLAAAQAFAFATPKPSTPATTALPLAASAAFPSLALAAAPLGQRSRGAQLKPPAAAGAGADQRETILLPGCDYNHWLIVMEFPKDPAPTREQMIDTYLNTLATVLGR